MKESNWLTFANKVRELKIRGDTVDNKWTNLTNDVKNAVMNSFPEKEGKHEYKFTMSQGLLKSKNKKKINY